MPHAAPQPCTHPGCTHLAEPGTKGRCTDHPHPTIRWGKRPTVRQRYGVSDTRWRRLRHHIQQRDQHRCYLCGQPAHQVDHIQPIAEHGAPTDPTNLAAICRPCHHAKTQREINRSNQRRAH